MRRGKALAATVALAATTALSSVVVPMAAAGGDGVPEVLRLLEEILANQAKILQQLEGLTPPDLAPNPYYHHLGPEGPADFCRILDSGALWVSVYNQGAGPAAASLTHVLFRVPAGLEGANSCGVGCAQVSVSTPAMQSRRSIEHAVSIPAGCFGSAFGPDDINNCQFKIIVDATNVLNEASEANNSAFGACQGLL